jgi:hypothetical protein
VGGNHRQGFGGGAYKRDEINCSVRLFLLLGQNGIFLCGSLLLLPPVQNKLHIKFGQSQTLKTLTIYINKN